MKHALTPLAILAAVVLTALALEPVLRIAPYLADVDEVRWFSADGDLRPRRIAVGERARSLRRPGLAATGPARQYEWRFDRAEAPEGEIGVLLPTASPTTRLFINGYMLERQSAQGDSSPSLAEIPRFGLQAHVNRVEIVTPSARPNEWPRGLYFGPLAPLKAAALRLSFIDRASMLALAGCGGLAAMVGFGAASFIERRRTLALPSLLALIFAASGGLAVFGFDDHRAQSALVAVAAFILFLLAAGESEDWPRAVKAAFRLCALGLAGLPASLVISFWNEAAAVVVAIWCAVGVTLVGSVCALAIIFAGKAPREIWPAQARAAAALVALSLMALGLSRIGLLGTAAFIAAQNLGAVAAALAALLWLVFVGAVCVLDIERLLQRRLGLSRVIREQEAALAEKQRALEAEIAKRAVLEERERFSRDIHDGVGGSLISLLAQARTGALSENELKTSLERALEDLRLMIDALDHSRTSAPSAFSTFQTRIAPAFAAAGVALDWRQDDLPPDIVGDPRRLMQVFRILQEACANVLKHAKAGAASVRIGRDAENGGLEVLVEDDGERGADPSSSGHGLKNMTRRAAEIGGSLTAGPKPGGTGWRVRLVMPQASPGA